MHFSFSLIMILRAFWINRNGLTCLESTPSKSLKNLLKKVSFFINFFAVVLNSNIFLKSEEMIW